MCGILGVIGQSINIERSHELITWLIRETQVRGHDATGYYSIDLEGNPDWFKTNRSAEKFIRMKPWKKQSKGTNILIGHTRAQTHGTELRNINNHPHVSDNGNLAIVHNGMIFNHKVISKRNGLNLRGECDSEVILQIINSEKDVVKGIQKVFKEISSGSMACLGVHKDNDKSYLYVFRNSSNPISWIDLREELGQIFFFSTDYIWDSAVQSAGLEKIIGEVKPQQVPAYEIWKIYPKTLEIVKEKDIEKTSSYSFNYDYGGYSLGNFDDEDDDDNRAVKDVIEDKISALKSKLDSLDGEIFQDSTITATEYEEISNGLDKAYETINEIGKAFFITSSVFDNNSFNNNDSDSETLLLDDQSMAGSDGEEGFESELARGASGQVLSERGDCDRLFAFGAS